MKKIYAILSAALLIAAAASCTKENTFADNLQAEGTTFTTTLDEDAKLTIDGQGKSTWTPNEDYIVIYNGNYTDDFAIFRDQNGNWDTDYVQDIKITSDMISSDGKKVTFNVDIPAPNAGKWYLAAVGSVYMVPAFLKDGPIYAVFPNPIKEGEMPFLASTTSTTNKATFHNNSTLIRMKCSLPGAQYVTFERNDGQYIVNEGDILFNEDGTTEQIYDPRKNVHRLRSNIAGLGKDDYFYIGMFPQDLPNGFTLKVYTDEQSSHAANMVVNKPMSLKAGHVLDLGDIYTGAKRGKNGWTVFPYTGHETGASYLVDNDIKTFWQGMITDGSPAIFILDLQEKKTFNQIILSQVCGNSSVAASGYVWLYVSNDLEQPWIQVIPEAKGLEQHGYRQHIDLLQTYEARYVQLLVWNSYDPQKPASLAEFDIALKGTDHDYVSSTTGYEKPDQEMTNGGYTSRNIWFFSDGGNYCPAWGQYRWQRVTDWIHNDAMKISCDVSAEYGTAQMCYWSVGDQVVTNGKVYQRHTLLPGQYTYVIRVDHTATPNNVEVYGAVSKGEELPDIANLSSQAIAYKRVDNADWTEGKESVLKFEINEITEVCIGCVGSTTKNETPNQPWSELYFTYFRLYPWW